MLTIRPLTGADESGWRSLWHDYLAFYRTELSEEIYRVTFARLIDPAEAGYNGLLALDDTRPVGLAHYIYHRHGWQIEEVCYLQDLFVAPDVRGTGAGRALIKAVYAAADAAGRGNVYWLTETTNQTARQLYDRIGVATPFMKYRR